MVSHLHENYSFYFIQRLLVHIHLQKLYKTKVDEHGNKTTIDLFYSFIRNVLKNYDQYRETINSIEIKVTTVDELIFGDNLNWQVSVTNAPGSEAWVLSIDMARRGDRGHYECQVIQC